MLRQDTDRACYLAQWGRGLLCALPLGTATVFVDVSACLFLSAVLALGTCYVINPHSISKKKKKECGPIDGGPGAR